MTYSTDFIPPDRFVSEAVEMVKFCGEFFSCKMCVYVNSAGKCKFKEAGLTMPAEWIDSSHRGG